MAFDVCLSAQAHISKLPASALLLSPWHTLQASDLNRASAVHENIHGFILCSKSTAKRKPIHLTQLRGPSLKKLLTRASLVMLLVHKLQRLTRYAPSSQKSPAVLQVCHFLLCFAILCLRSCCNCAHIVHCTHVCFACCVVISTS